MAWPATVLPPVDVNRAEVRLDDGWLTYLMPAAPFSPLGHEVVIRDLLKLECRDDAEVVSFIATHGVLERREDIVPDGFRPGDGPERRNQAHINDARYFLRASRALARHWLADCLAEDVAEAWHEEFMAPGSVVEDTAWLHFAHYLSVGLQPFHARVEYRYVVENNRPRVDLYSALCHQLFNLFVEGSPVQRCANETCGQAFVRQSGRAQHGQYRTEGVIYCSKSCARAQVERQRRRRLKGERQ